MEKLLREILAPSPTLPSATLPATSTNEAATQLPTSSTGSPTITKLSETVDWEGEAEMQRLLDMLPDVQTESNGIVEIDLEVNDFPSTLDLELGDWDMGSFTQPPSSTSLVGVF